MSDFKAKMHRNLISAGALPQTPLGSLQRSPTPQLDLRGPTRKGKRYRKGGEGRGRERQGMGKSVLCSFSYDTLRNNSNSI